MSTALAADAQKTLRHRKRDLYRSALLDAAERVFAADGFEATKVQRIAAEAGLSLTTLYGVFESKWEIYRAVYARRLGEVMERARGFAVAGSSPLDKLIAGTRMQLEFFMDRPDFTQMQLKEVTAWSAIELLRSPEQVEALGAGLKLFAAVIRDGVRQGVFVDDDPELMARTAIACQQVRLARWMERGRKENPRQVIDATLRHLLRSLCRTKHLAAAFAAARLEKDA